ncbi:lytic transglycosylase domain-containing protein [Sphingobium sp. Sx8-8]|uniref:lytic transglycosylase domain-containing protein n=1 Tax=Sphingobium sp. Sx8-8 TaxID=2933617 RepID=UPI001F58ED88|nr:lytic transglycosylase domain-containing protein [Sphingobium sp. Sx8-8]
MRRTFLLAGLILAGTDAVEGATSDRIRTVQLIEMGAAISAREPTGRSGTTGAVVQQFGVPVTDVVLARRSDDPSTAIEAMARFMADGALGEKPWSGADPGEPASFSFPASATPIPSWMTGGQVHSSASPRWVPGCLPLSYQPAGFLTADAETRRQAYYGLMSEIACEYGIPVGLFDAMIIQESRYRHHVFSSKNAYGLTQLMPGTAAELGVDRYIVDQNLRGGARYLRRQLDRFGQVHLALAAYNAGPGRIRRAMVPRIRQTRLYVDDILRNWSRLSGLAVPGAWPETQASAGDRQDMAPYRMAQVSTF